MFSSRRRRSREKKNELWKQMSLSRWSFTIYARSAFYPSLRFTLSLQSAFTPGPQSAVRSPPQSAIRSPQSAVRSPQSAVRSPQSFSYTDLCFIDS